MQLKKRCYSEQEEGEKIELISAFTEQEEAFMVASSISESMFRNKVTYGDFAILYRTNAQSRVIEEALRRKNMPYRIFAAHSFYERAEIKDMLAYFRLVLNPKDNEAFTRIINFPARGIGDVTLARLKAWAQTENMSYVEVLKRGGYEQYGLKEKVIEKLVTFSNTLDKLREQVFSENAYDMALKIDSCFGISQYLRQDVSLEGQSRLQNVEELLNSIKEFVEEGYENQIEEETDQSDQTSYANQTNLSDQYNQIEQSSESEHTLQADPTSQLGQSEQLNHPYQTDQAAQLISLDLYMQNVSLLSDVDTSDDIDDKNKISLMTVHSAKGLEFPYVYIIGAEENLFPSCSSSSSDSEIEEERRLFYVAMTRAKESVKISFAHSRIKWGSHVNNEPSRFIKEIDSCYIVNPLSQEKNEYCSKRTNSYESGKNNYSFGNTNCLLNRGFVKVSSAKPMAPRNPNFIADSPTKLKVGQHVEHERFGKGVILSLEGSANEMKAVVNFDECGKKTLLLKFAKIRIISE
jgi:Superfamily I DNA and RNA helicases